MNREVRIPRAGSARAYSLYELVMTLGLVSIVLTLGIPSFTDLVANHRLRVEVDRLFHAVHLARKESVVRRRVVTLCPSPDGVDCVPGGEWAGGWMLFVNRDRDLPARRDTNELLVRRENIDPGVRIVSNRDSYSLRSTELRATNGTLVFCSRSGRGTPRALVISYTGRPRVTYEDSRGRPYACPD